MIPFVDSRRARRVLPALLALTLGAALVVPASAATTNYEGSVKGMGPVSFRVAGQKVKRFQASMSVTCVSVAPARSDIEIYVVAPGGAAALNRQGRFQAKIDLPKQQQVDSSGEVQETLYEVEASIDGKVSGKSAKGGIKVSYNKFWTAYNPGTGYYELTIASCFSGSAKTPWTASHR